MNGTFCGLSSLILFPSASNKQKEILSSRGSDCYFVRRSSWLTSRFAHKLINESVGTFLSLQSLKAEIPVSDMQSTIVSDIQSTIVKKSREYRSMIQACVGEMNCVLESESFITICPEEKAELPANCQLLYKMELVLGLIEIVFIDTKPGCIVFGQLINWIRFHFPNPKDKLAELLSLDSPHLHQSYWETVYGLVLQGYMSEVRTLFSRHPDTTSDAFMSIDELLRKMPIYQFGAPYSEAEFTIHWQHWQDECNSRLQLGEFANEKHLQTVCEILCGKKETFLSLLDILDTWYHLMVSTILYTNPTLKLFRLLQFAHVAISDFGISLQMGSLDYVLLTVLEADAQQVLKQCQLVIDNIWFTSHLSDILYHSLKEKQEKLEYLLAIREFLLADYASDLVACSSSLWQVALLYLDHAGSPPGVIEAFLESIPLDSDFKARKVIKEAMERNLDHIAFGVCKVMGHRALTQHQLGAATWWAIQSRDSAFTSHLAHTILLKYISDGCFKSSSLLDYLGPAMLLSDALTFLVLLLDCLPLLNCEEPIFSMEQTYELMYCIHSLTKSAGGVDIKRSREEESAYRAFLEQEKEIRFALTNNLSKAIIQEGSKELY